MNLYSLDFNIRLWENFWLTRLVAGKTGNPEENLIAMMG